MTGDPSAASDLERLLAPRSIAVIGGGSWCRNVLRECQKIGFSGTLRVVHPQKDQLEGIPAFRAVKDLPEAPDAAFVGVNRAATVEVVRQLAAMGAGGAVCFASGFLEAKEEAADGADLQKQLLDAAGDMPILGPNCYGFLNLLDGALLWPDQHGAQRCSSGVAIVTQSSNIAINLTMQARGLPIAYVVTAGNQAQTSLSQIGAALLRDPRVTALGLHIEGVGDLRDFEALAATARQLGKRIVAIKAGRSAQARAAAVSHTASLAGEDAGATALLRRLGIARMNDLPAFLEALKLLHCGGPLTSNALATISCSGGEASLAADSAQGLALHFPPLNARQQADLRNVLGPMVSLSNPLDYHTYIWRDVEAMAQCFAAMVDPALAITLLIIDFPRADRCDASDWDCTILALIRAREMTGARLGMIATLPEAMPEAVATRLMEAGIIAFAGLPEALAACEAAALDLPAAAQPIALPVFSSDHVGKLVPEAEAKAALSAFGVTVPKGVSAGARNLAEAASALQAPLVLKSVGSAHKSDRGGVALGLGHADLPAAAARMGGEAFLVEEMVQGGLAELLIGVVCDPAHGYVLTLAAGGTLTELWQDSVQLLLPETDANIEAALKDLRIWPLLHGYRGSKPANLRAIVDTVQALTRYVLDSAAGLEEIEINPLICTATSAVAADALLRRKDL